MQEFRAEVFQMEQNVILARAAATALVDFDRHRAADDIPSGQVFGGRSIPFHEALARRIGEITTFATRAFGD
jgi:hypothetical protein